MDLLLHFPNGYIYNNNNNKKWVASFTKRNWLNSQATNWPQQQPQKKMGQPLKSNNLFLGGCRDVLLLLRLEVLRADVEQALQNAIEWKKKK